MNAPFFPPEADAAFASATLAVNAWRGRCVDIFAGAECAVAETLLRSGGGKLPHLAGQRRQALIDRLRDRAVAAAAVAALEGFRRHDRLRTMLCHGKARVTLDRAGRWHAVFRLVTDAGNGDVLAIEERDAAAQAQCLARDGRRIVDLLRGLAPEG